MLRNFIGDDWLLVEQLGLLFAGLQVHADVETLRTGVHESDCNNTAQTSCSS